MNPPGNVENQIDPRDVWIVIAAYNEAGAIGGVIDSLRPFPYQIAVTDDGSEDGTFDALAGLPVHRLRHPVNLGQGAALKTGMLYALRNGAKYLVTFDADGQHRASEIPAMLDPLARGYDVALGTRFGSGGQAVNLPPARRVLLKLAIFYTRLTIGLGVSDTHNGFRAFTAEAARRIEITRNRMAHATQILEEIKRLKLSYKEVPVNIDYTKYSLRKGQRASNALNILWESFREVFKP